MKASVNQGLSFETEFINQKPFLNNEFFEWDLLEYEKGKFNIIHDAISYKIEILQIQRESKTVEMLFNKQKVTVALHDKFDLLLQQMGIDVTKSAKINHLKAPMPGLIVEIKVSVGDQVEKGDALLILEAMKMENVIKAQGIGKIKSIKVEPKSNVEKGQLLMEFE